MIERLTQHTGDEAEDDGGCHEGPVPIVGSSNRGDAKKDEDERLTHTAPHLQEVFDSGVGLVGNIGLQVWAHDHPTGNQTGNRNTC